MPLSPDVLQKKSSMVLRKALHHHRGPVRGAAGLAPDLVASPGNAGMEDRVDHRGPCAELDIVSLYDGVDPYH